MLVIEVGGDSHDRQLVRVAVEGVPWPVRASIGGGGIVAHDVGASRCNGIVEASSRGVPHRQQVMAWKMLLPVVAVNHQSNKLSMSVALCGNSGHLGFLISCIQTGQVSPTCSF